MSDTNCCHRADNPEATTTHTFLATVDRQQVIEFGIDWN